MSGEQHFRDSRQVLWIEQSPRQVPEPMRRSTHNYIFAIDLIKEQVFVKWTCQDKKPPTRKARISESACRPKMRMFAQQFATPLDCLQVSVGNFQISVFLVPLELPLNI
jgi:hypothetical protein